MTFQRPWEHLSDSQRRKAADPLFFQVARSLAAAQRATALTNEDRARAAVQANLVRVHLREAAIVALGLTLPDATQQAVGELIVWLEARAC